MQIFLKSSGRKDTQDYVWVSLSHEEHPDDMQLLRSAERATSPRMHVVSLFKQSSARVAVYLGSAPSDRKDFYGTPIKNRLGLLFDIDQESDFKVVRMLMLDWLQPCSKTANLLATNVVASSDNQQGFSWGSNLVESLSLIGNTAEFSGETGMATTRSMVDAALSAMKDHPRTHFEQTIEMSPDVDWDIQITKQEKKNVQIENRGREPAQMKVYFNTVVSGERDYAWWRNERPVALKRLLHVCERIRTADVEKCYFAALDRQQNQWCVFLQGKFGFDSYTRRPARITLAVEIPDSDGKALSDARALVADWLLEDSRLLSMLKKCVDISGEEWKVDEKSLLSESSAIARDHSALSAELPVPLEHSKPLRLSRDLSNAAGLKQRAREYITTHDMPTSEGVHFLYTCTPYTDEVGTTDGLPDIPARFIVVGYNPNCPSGTIINQRPSIVTENVNESGEDICAKKTMLPLIVGTGVALVCLILLLTLFLKRSTTSNPDMTHKQIIPEQIKK